MLEQDYKAFVVHNKLILPEQPYHDDFLHVITKVFQFSSFVGILGSKKYISYLWTCILMCTLLYIEVMAIWKVIKALAGWAVDIVGHRSVAARFAGTLFYSISISSLILASRLSRSWPDLKAAWSKAERTIALNVPADKTLKRRLYTIAVLMLCFSLLEHIMSIISNIGLDCPPELILKRYVLLSHGFMILRNEYSEWYAIPLLIISTIASLLWNFQDLIIILISIGLTSRYNRLNQCLSRFCALDKKQNMDSDKFIHNFNSSKKYECTWRKLREAYVKQAFLVRKMDSALGGIIILSCLCNFYFICLQLFMGITQGPVSSPIKKAYYILSLTWLCVRVTSVVLAASGINTHSQLALKYIYTYDTHGYNIEVERLQDQLTKDYIALSGMGFFYLTKTILLQMVGAIITYELVLIQFDNKGSDNTDNITLNVNTTIF